MSDNLLDLLEDNSKNTSKERPPRERGGFLGGLKKSVVENTESSLKKSQSSNNFNFEMDNEKKPFTLDNDKKGLVIDNTPNEEISSFGIGLRRGMPRTVIFL
jgi:hypothetical protein